MKLKSFGTSVALLALSTTMLANVPPYGNAQDNSVINTQLTTPVNGVAMGPNSEGPNVQTVVINQQMNLLNQMQKLQQTVNNLNGVLQNQAQAIQQMQLQIMAMQQAFKQQGINVSSDTQMPVVNSAVQKTNNATAANINMPSTVSSKPQVAPATAMTNNAPVVTAATVSQAASSNSASTASTSSLQDNEVKLYKLAYQQVQDKDYSTAINSFQEYLKKYPKGQFADNAHFWLGQLYGIAGNDQQSFNELSFVVTSYPKSSKVPEALLQLGMMAYTNGQYADAMRWFNKLITEFPNSGSANVAKQQLQQLQKAGY